MKPKVGVFSFTGCEGCQLQILECEDELLSILGLIDLVVFREAMDKISDNYDIAFIDGGITHPSEIERIKKIYHAKVFDTPHILMKTLDEQKRRLEECKKRHGDYPAPDVFGG